MSEYCPFWVGQKVVCVDDVPVIHHKVRTGMHGLTRGNVYTVRKIGKYDHSSLGEYIGVWLTEIVRPAPDTPFDYVRFRPATDITLLEEIARTAKLPEEVLSKVDLSEYLA